MRKERIKRERMHFEHFHQEQGKNHFKAKMLGGIFVIGFGVLILLNQMGMQIPDAVISWEAVLILVGIVSLVKHNFKKLFGLVLIAIGGVFMLNDFYPDAIETRFLWPVLIIFFGITIFVKAFSQKKNSKYTILNDTVDTELNDEDYFESTAFFGGVNKNVVSKNFKGARIVTIFGGTELNLSHADFENQVSIEVKCVFGGVNIIVPSNWKVQSDITSAFGGIDDKRQVSLIDENSGKLLILKGSCVFGGVEIISYA